MNAEFTTPTRDEAIEEASKWGVGLGIVTFALFPLSIPFLILTVVALLPLALPLVALALVAAIVAAPVMLVRRLAAGSRADKVKARKGFPWRDPTRDRQGSPARS